MQVHAPVERLAIDDMNQDQADRATDDEAGGRTEQGEQAAFGREHPADLADIMEELSPVERQSIVASLDEETAAEALAELDKRAMQKVLASVDTKTLSISLKGSSARVEENIMANLSSRVREMVKDERDLAGAMSLKEVGLARGEVLKAVRGLMESGEFRPARAGDELVT